MCMASCRPVHTISRFLCMGCERLGEFHRLFGSRQAAKIHIGMTPDCRALGLGVREISVAAGTGADVMAGGAGAAGAAPDVLHQPSGYTDLYCSNYCITWDILGYPELSQNEGYPTYPGISRDNPTRCISHDNTGQHWATQHNPPKFSLSFFSVGKTTG